MNPREINGSLASSSVTSTKIPRLYEAEDYKSKYFGISVKPGISQKNILALFIVPLVITVIADDQMAQE